MGVGVAREISGVPRTLSLPFNCPTQATINLIERENAIIFNILNLCELLPRQGHSVWRHASLISQDTHPSGAGSF